MIEIDTKEIRKEIKRRQTEDLEEKLSLRVPLEVQNEFFKRQQLREPVTLSCPLTEIEGCNQIGYSDHCQNCQTVQNFFDACPFRDKRLEEEVEKEQKETVDSLLRRSTEIVDTEFDKAFFQELITGFLTGEINNILYKEEGDEEIKREISELTNDELIELQALIQLQERLDDQYGQTATVIEKIKKETNTEIRQFLEKYIVAY